MYPNDPQSSPPPVHFQQSSLPQQNSDSDRTHLMLLSIFYYVMAGLNAIGIILGCFYLFLGSMMPMEQFHKSPNYPPPEFFKYFFAGLGGCIALMSLALTILDIHAGYSIQKRKNRTMILISAGINCLSVPLGTGLGVFTFIVLNRLSVRVLFANPITSEPTLR
jgi:hypothetical protein